MNLKKFLLILTSTFVFIGCDGPSSTLDSSIPLSSIVSVSSQDASQNSTSNSESSASNPSASSPSIWEENQISIEELETALQKALEFKNINQIEYYRKDNFRYEKTTYKRYDYFYTLQGEVDSYQDAIDGPENLIGYYGYPSDGSINKFYDILKGDPEIQHAKLYSIVDTPTKNSELTEEQANTKLDDYENNLEHLINETYYHIKDEKNEMMDVGSLKAYREEKNGIDTITITATKTYTYLYQEYQADYTFEIQVNKDGSFSSFYFHLDDEGILTTNSIKLSYGDYFDPSTLNTIIFDPEIYFVKKLYDVNFQDPFTSDLTNCLSIGSSAYLIPYQDNFSSSSMFKYLPATGLDYWDINVLSSSNTDVIAYSELNECFEAIATGTTILTIGQEYNPYLNIEIEVSVIYSEPESIVASAPFNQEDYVGEAFTNGEITIPVQIGPYTAEQKMTVRSSDESIATAYINEEGEVKVRGIKEGAVQIIVASEVNPEISRSFNINVVGEFKKEMIVGHWSDESLYSAYKIKFDYYFNAYGIGQMILIGQDYFGEEQTYYIPFDYEIDVANQDIKITPRGNMVVNEDLLTVHYYNSSFMQSHFTYGEYYFSINLTPGALVL